MTNILLFMIRKQTGKFVCMCSLSVDINIYLETTFTDGINVFNIDSNIFNNFYIC